MSPLSRKCVEPMAAHVDPLKVRSRHQSLHHFVADARGAARQVAQQWRGMRQVAVGPVNRDAARGLAARGEAVLQASQVLVAMLENAAGTAQARLINLAGRQRMLSQRLAKLYMLRAYGVDTASIRDDLDSASREFETALASLRAAPENTPAIAVELEAVALQWEWFHGAIALQGAESYALVVADEGSSRSTVPPLADRRPPAVPDGIAADIGRSRAGTCPCESALTPTAAPAPRTSP